MENKQLSNGSVVDHKPYANRLKEMADAMGSYMRAIMGGADDPQRYASFEEFFDEFVSLVNEQIDRKLRGYPRQESPL